MEKTLYPKKISFGIMEKRLNYGDHSPDINKLCGLDKTADFNSQNIFYITQLADTMAIIMINNHISVIFKKIHIF